MNCGILRIPFYNKTMSSIENRRFANLAEVEEFSDENKEEVHKDGDSASAPEGSFVLENISEELDNRRSKVWIKNRLERMDKNFVENNSGEHFIKKFGHNLENRQATYYYKPIIDELKKMIDEEERVPLLGEDEVTMRSMRRTFGLDKRWLKQKVEDTLLEAPHLKPKLKRIQGGKTAYCYSKEFVDKLKAELEKNELAPEGAVVENNLSEALDGIRSKEWAMKEINNMDKDFVEKNSRFHPILLKGKPTSNKTTYYYQPIIDELKKKLRELPELNDYFFIKDGAMTAKEMAKKFPAGIIRIEKFIEGLVDADTDKSLNGRWITKDGVRDFYYPKKLVDIIDAITSGDEEIVAPEGWMTLDKLAKTLPRSKNWIGEHILDMKKDYVSSNSEEFFPEGKRVKKVLHWHYSPELIKELKRLIEEDDKIHEITEETEMSRRVIANNLGRSSGWVKREIDNLLGEHPELTGTRGKKTGQAPRTYYSKEIVDKLREISDKKPRGSGRWGKRG